MAAADDVTKGDADAENDPEEVAESEYAPVMASKETEVQEEVAQGDAVPTDDSKEESEAETAPDTSRVRVEEPKKTEYNTVHAPAEQEAI